MTNLFKEVFKRLFQVFIFLLPVQLGYHFWPEWAFVFGIRVDYLSPTLYLTDVLFLILFLLFLITQKAGKKAIIWGFVAISVFGAINSFSALSFQPAVYKWIKIFELFCLAALVARSKQLRAGEWIAKPLLFSLGMVALIGIAQVVKGGSLGGIVYFLGERAFSLSTPGIALTSLGGRELLRAYSIFSHPNSLAGFLGAGIILSSPLLFRAKRTLNLVLLAIILFAFVLTFSLAPAISLLVVLTILLFFRKNSAKLSKLAKGLLFLLATISIALPLIASRGRDIAKQWGESYSGRVDLAVSSGRMFSEKPLFGIGLNNFTISLPAKSVGHPFSWWLQPVHNIFLLSLSETGLTGFLVLVFLFYLALKNSSPRNKTVAAALLFILLTGFFDHYWLTLQQNQLLLAITLGLSFKNA